MPYELKLILWKIVSRLNGKVLDVLGASTEDKAPIVVYHDHGGISQQWGMTQLQDGSLEIKSRVSGKVLDVPGYSAADHLQIEQYTGNDGNNQRWKIVPVTDNSFKIVSLATGKVLEVLGASMDDNARVVQAQDNGGISQQWERVPLPSPPLPTELHFHANSITFDAGIALGGFAHLTLRQDGSYTFSGHFHDSGAIEYNTSLLWAIKDFGCHVYTFQRNGHTNGTFEIGSRDDDWTIDSKNDDVAKNWEYLGIGNQSVLSVSVKSDYAGFTLSTISLLGLVVGLYPILGGPSVGSSNNTGSTGGPTLDNPQIIRDSPY